MWVVAYGDKKRIRIMVRFNKKESEARKELLQSMNQVNDAKENENGKQQSTLNPDFAKQSESNLVTWL